MSNSAHLWAVGYENAVRAEQVRDEIMRLRGAGQYMVVLDTAVVVRNADGTLTLDRESFPLINDILGCTTIGFLAGLVVGVPLGGAAIGALLGSAGSAAVSAVGIDNAFIQEVTAIMTPGTSALFVLDYVGNMDVILHAIRGLGGTVLRTNVDLKQAKLIQSTLMADSVTSTKPDTPAT